MRFNEKFPEPLLTPSTKAERGEHDVPVSREEILQRGVVTEDTLDRLEKTALALFERGSEIVRRSGLILVDTKYEFGYGEDGLVLVDEIHTPDSSRYWYAETYEERFSRGEYPKQLDKEYLRRWLMGQGFQGDGDPPAIPDPIRLDVAERYIRAYEEITGRSFAPSGLGAEEIVQDIAGFFRQRE
jgi:phosphoribosylaminoimidazole-succinocarboxamide synthase